MKYVNMKDHYWMKWSNNQEGCYYNESKYEQVEGFEGNSVYKITFQDEQGRELTASFEAFKSTSSEVPAVGLTMLSIIRPDTNEQVEVEEALYREFFDHTMVRVCENDKDILENVPAW
tara:strand:+ start:4027 stop:4380 length:354 start_codon:yes stop_codon:yes gene_type:complete